MQVLPRGVKSAAGFGGMPVANPGIVPPNLNGNANVLPEPPVAAPQLGTAVEPPVPVEGPTLSANALPQVAAPAPPAALTMPVRPDHPQFDNAAFQALTDPAARQQFHDDFRTQIDGFHDAMHGYHNDMRAYHDQSRPQHGGVGKVMQGVPIPGQAAPTGVMPINPGAVPGTPVMGDIATALMNRPRGGR